MNRRYHDIDCDLERRIVRMLDGELDDEQKVELYRQVLRQPAAHRLMSDYAADDELAGDALHALLDGSGISGPTLLGRASGAVPAHRRRPVRWLAAAVAAVAVLGGGVYLAQLIGDGGRQPGPAAGDGAVAIHNDHGADSPAPPEAPETTDSPDAATTDAGPGAEEEVRGEAGDGRGDAVPAAGAEPRVAPAADTERRQMTPAEARPGREYVGIVDPGSDTIILIQVDDDSDSDAYADF